MNRCRRQPITKFLGLALVLGLLALGAAACEKSAQERLLVAKTAVLNEKPDIAQEHLDAVLKAEPNNFEARRLSAAVRQLRGDYAGAEEKYLALQKAEGFELGDKAREDAQGAKLSAEQKTQRELLKRDLIELYQDWAGALTPGDDMETFEQVAQKGLALAPKRPRLNALLSDAYEQHAKRLVEQGKKLEAVEVYEKIPSLYTSSATRAGARERASNLRFEANRDQMLAYFNETARPKLEAQQRYDADKQFISFSVEQPVSEVEQYVAERQGTRVRLDTRTKQAQDLIHEYAIANKLRPALVKLVVEATGIPEDSDFSRVRAPEGFEATDFDWTRTDYKVTARIPLDALLKLGFDVREHTRRMAEGDGEGEGSEEARAPEAAPQQPSAAADSAQ